MPLKTETTLPREVWEETQTLFSMTEQIPPEKLYGFFEFVQGVSYGLEMRNGQTVEWCRV